MTRSIDRTASTGERTLDPHRARAFLAAGIAARLAEMFAVFGVATVDCERHARILREFGTNQAVV
jgi:hypothetical protein